MIRIKKQSQMSSKIWEECILAVIGDAFGLGDEICGAVLVTKANEDIVSIWNRNADRKEVTLRIRDTLKQVLGINNNAALEYRPHDEAIKNLHLGNR